MNVQELEFSKVDPAPYNPRIRLRREDPEYQNIAASLSEFGLVQTLVFNQRSGNLVGGHQRMFIMQDNGLTKAHFTIVDLDDEQEKKLNIILNKVAGKWDRSKLEDVLSAMQAKNLDLSTLGFNPVELNDILKAKPKKTLRDPDDAPAPTKEDRATTKEGDLYHFISADGKPQHHLLCGSSEKHQDLEKLMQGARARMIFTDPPYGVSYVSQGLKEHAAIVNDELRENLLVEFLRNVFTAAFPHAIDKAALYCFYASRNHIEFETALRAAGWKVKQQLLWVKQMVLSRSDYHWAHEPLLYCTKASHNCEWLGPRTEKTLFNLTVEDIDKLGKEDALQMLRSLREAGDIWEERRDPPSTYIHPTQKPTSLARRAMRNSTMPGDNVLELFAGSGSTIIAGEQENRNVYAMEQSRGHCDSIVRRYLETFPDVAVTRNGQEFTLENFEAHA